jgi:hypothetical protein
MSVIFWAHITETCACCGAANRWWVSRKGYDSPEYGSWTETGLCPKCSTPKEE